MDLDSLFEWGAMRGEARLLVISIGAIEGLLLFRVGSLLWLSEWRGQSERCGGLGVLEQRIGGEAG
jgi:hypothetical protein